MLWWPVRFFVPMLVGMAITWSIWIVTGNVLLECLIGWPLSLAAGYWFGSRN